MAIQSISLHPRKMGRPATSFIEVEQVQQVSALVGAMASCPEKTVVVTTANGKRHTGKLLSHKSGSRLSKRGKQAYHFGSIELATDTGAAQIDYLDIVWIAPQ